jgi:hypothetical protein
MAFGPTTIGQAADQIHTNHKHGVRLQWITWIHEHCEHVGLEDLTKTDHILHFRFISSIKPFLLIIDIWTSDYLAFNGTQTYSTNVYNNSKRNRKKRSIREFISETNQIDSAVARQIYNLFTDQMIFEMRELDNIPEWTVGRDGSHYYVEYSAMYTYSFKYYWTPQHFKHSIEEARRLSTVVEELEELLDLRQSIKRFSDQSKKLRYWECSFNQQNTHQ